MASALKKRLRERPTTADITRCVQELESDGTRGAAVLACALLEDLLRLSILNKLVDLSKEDHDLLFTGTGPLASLWATTQIAFAMGIIGPKTKHDLNSMREIRNALAHTSLKIDFDTPEVAVLCGGFHTLSAIEEPADKAKALTARGKYTAVTKALMIRLIGTFAKDNSDLPARLIAKE
jgi:DNA-binding MltR family transcriptional regulator